MPTHRRPWRDLGADLEPTPRRTLTGCGIVAHHAAMDLHALSDDELRARAARAARAAERAAERACRLVVRLRDTPGIIWEPWEATADEPTPRVLIAGCRARRGKAGT